MKKTKAYVQFSKRIVVLVTIAVTVVCYVAAAFCFVRCDMAALVSTIKAYIQYATIVFVAYSGNSALEKWLLSRAKVAIPTDPAPSDTQDPAVG